MKTRHMVLKWSRLVADNNQTANARWTQQISTTISESCDHNSKMNQKLIFCPILAHFSIVTIGSRFNYLQPEFDGYNAFPAVFTFYCPLETFPLCFVNLVRNIQKRCSLPVPATENLPHSMMLPPPCFTVGMVLARWWAVPGVHHAKCLEFCQKSVRSIKFATGGLHILDTSQG